MENVTFLNEYFNDDLVIRLRSDSSGIYNDLDENMTQNEYELLKQPSYMIVLYALMYGLVFVFGLLGNTFVIAVIYKEPSMHNVTNYFILNMAVADLMVVLFCVPITFLGSIFTGWRYGEFMCKVPGHLLQSALEDLALCF
ncbi:neuropeptide SIFamide receptor-like [Dreissena polymorpha]|uniref:neuropeptide SIFamide receptor-like n=1 Tax=Dreissena polymorpha TaxID=45954 RepID=UPI00226415E6|nr:neuropeptide SIFamide receptor-like [Dreissena polymorpha]